MKLVSDIRPGHDRRLVSYGAVVGEQVLDPATPDASRRHRTGRLPRRLAGTPKETMVCDVGRNSLQ